MSKKKQKRRECNLATTGVSILYRCRRCGHQLHYFYNDSPSDPSPFISAPRFAEYVMEHITTMFRPHVCGYSEDGNQAIVGFLEPVAVYVAPTNEERRDLRLNDLITESPLHTPEVIEKMDEIGEFPAGESDGDTPSSADQGN
jgi:hypothetical protein